MATIIDLGRQTKAKYPQYQDLSDEEVGRRVKQKYPTQYSDFTDTFPTGEPAHVQKSFIQKLKSVGSTIGNALTSSEQTLGKGLSTVFDRNTQQTVADVNTKEGQSQQMLITAIHNETDPVKKQHLADTLKKIYNTNYTPVTAESLNEGFGLSNKQVIGAALGTALDVASFGSYGNAAKGAQSGQLLTKGANLAARTAGKSVEQIALETAKKTTKQYAIGVGKKVTQGAATGYGYDVSGNLQANKDNVFKPGAGTAVGVSIPLAVEAIKGAGFIAKQVAKYTASGLSGTPVAAIEEGFKNPEKVQNAMRSAALDHDGATQQILDDAQSAMDNLKVARTKAYEQNLAKLEQETFYTKKGQLYVKRVLSGAEATETKGYVPGTKVGVPTDLGTKGIKDVFTRTLKKFGATGGGQGLDFTNVALEDTFLNKVSKLKDRIYAWNDFTPTGLNRLNQVVDSYYVGGLNLGSSEKKFNAIVTALQDNLGSYVGTRVPQVAEMNAAYKAETEVINNINNQLKLNAKDPSTALRKLLNVFNPKSTVYKPVVEQLGEEGAKSLMSDIAGLTMSKWTPEGIAKYLDLTGVGLATFLNPSALVAAPAASPRIVGEVTTTLGKIAKNKTAQAAAKIVGKTGNIAKKLLTRKAGLSK